MPIDSATLQQYINEVSEGDPDLANVLQEKFGKNQNAAAKFVGGFLGRADVTRKQQELADQRKSFEGIQSEYENRLTQAEAEKTKIMRALADERITGSKAMALLNTVKEAYSLTDADLPGIDDVRATERTGKVVDSTPDLDQRFASFEDKILQRVSEKLIPEISSLAVLGPIWNEIGYEHQQLFGKRLSKQEQTAILDDARKNNRSLESAWQEKYNVSDKRLEVRDETNKSKWKLEWADEQAKRNQEEALAGVRNQDTGAYTNQSPLFKRTFNPPTESATTATDPATSTRAAASRTDAQVERGGAAERAAAKWMERSRSGQLGKPIESRQSA
jgi:hypothetical protein